MNRNIRFASFAALLFAASALFAQAPLSELPEPIAPSIGEVALIEPAPEVEAKVDPALSVLALWTLDPGTPFEVIEFTSMASYAQAAATDASTAASESEGEWKEPEPEVVIPPGLLNNQHYRESIRLKRLADEAFEYGDYDASADLAAQAARAALRSDEYIAERLRMKAEADALAAAKAAAAKEAAAKAAREAADKAAADRAAAKAAAEKEAAERAAAEARRLQMLAADDAISKARLRMDWALSVGADKTYPVQFGEASKAYDASLKARAAEDWDGAVANARRVLDLLADVKELAPLPLTYTVRTWAQERDCFWNIAGYPFVYGDPTKWTLLYEANKAKLRRPDNPNLIHPGIILTIPSIRGEVREGAWVKGRAYSPLPPKRK